MTGSSGVDRGSHRRLQVFESNTDENLRLKFRQALEALSDTKGPRGSYPPFQATVLRRARGEEVVDSAFRTSFDWERRAISKLSIRVLDVELGQFGDHKRSVSARQVHIRNMRIYAEYSSDLTLIGVSMFDEPRAKSTIVAPKDLLLNRTLFKCVFEIEADAAAGGDEQLWKDLYSRVTAEEEACLGYATRIRKALSEIERELDSVTLLARPPGEETDPVHSILGALVSGGR